MTNTITAYRFGGFTTEPAPDWWAAETDEVFNAFRMEIGMTEEGLLSRPVHEGHAVVLTMPAADFVGYWPMVWCPTEADFLAFICGPGASYVKAAAAAHSALMLDRIGNVLTSYARHGGGKHVDREHGRSATDTHQDRLDIEQQERIRAGQVSKGRPPS